MRDYTCPYGYKPSWATICEPKSKGGIAVVNILAFFPIFDIPCLLLGNCLERQLLLLQSSHNWSVSSLELLFRSVEDNFEVQCLDPPDLPAVGDTLFMLFSAPPLDGDPRYWTPSNEMPSLVTCMASCSSLNLATMISPRRLWFPYLLMGLNTFVGPTSFSMAL
jgi:hypothetical protein